MPIAIYPLGACQVKFNGVDLGPTLGGVSLKEDIKFVAHHEDGHGEAPVGGTITGKAVTAEAKFTDQTWAQIEDVIEGAVSDGSSILVSNAVGTDMYSGAHELVLTRLINNVPSVAPADVVTVFKAYPVAKPTLAFDNKTQKIIDVVFQCFPSKESGHLGEIYRVGTET